MTGIPEVRNPVVLWAQRKPHVYLTIAIEDCKDASVTIESDKVIFKGTGGDKNQYGCTLNLYGQVKPDESKYVTRDRATEILLIKESSSREFWPRLLKETVKMHWLKVDFNKWKDEDDSDAEGDPMGGGNFAEMMRMMGGSGSPDGSGGDFDDADSDDEGLPDLEPAKPEAIDLEALKKFEEEDKEDKKE